MSRQQRFDEQPAQPFLFQSPGTHAIDQFRTETAAEFAGEKTPVKVRIYSWGPKFAIGITHWGTCYIPKSMMEAARTNMDDEGCTSITMRPASGRHPFRATWINEQ